MSSITHKVQNRLERLIFGSGLVFHLTWEDPAVDRQALAITPDDSLITIASAGDNVLAIALDGPKQIYAVDLNPTQIFLLQIKIAAAQHLNYKDFWRLFSLDPVPSISETYHVLRPHLGLDAQCFWDTHLSLFQRGLYRAGIFGFTLWLQRTYLRMVCGRNVLEQFFKISSLTEQAKFYHRKIHTKWWNVFAKPFVDHWFFLLLFGAHPYQARRVQNQQFADFLASGIRRALTTIPAQDNFLWQQAFLGRYLVSPDYSSPENFGRLKEVVSRIRTYHGRLQHLLEELPPRSVTCFNLLDAPDWLSPDETVMLWTLIQRVAAPGARVLFRTIDPSYQLPPSILESWHDETDPTWTIRERTGVYAKVCLYVLCCIGNDS
jgi:S-adenosylmethionine-diacylglycerol 3-amino-3-carboxypropyl transferase